jgi:hypothetical protein
MRYVILLLPLCHTALNAFNFNRQVMEIKPPWLLEVAPHYFKPTDLEQLMTRDKKMPKAVGMPSGAL